MKFFYRLVCLIAITAILSGCKATQLGYFADTYKNEEGTIPLNKSEITIQPNDELIINVTSPFPEATYIYNLPFNSPISLENRKSNLTGTEKVTYVVGTDGYILFPILGKIHVVGLTTQQLAEEIANRISKDVEDPYVKVELINFTVNVMGEVMVPGHYKFDTERVTVADALAKAGDLTIYGKRDNVIVWREENGVMTYHKLNLKDSKSLSSPYYYLRQNDMIYVEPSDAREGQGDYNENNAFKVNVVSAIVSGVSVIASLIIALVVK